MNCFTKKRASFAIEGKNETIFVLAEFCFFEASEDNNCEFGVGCIILEIEDVAVSHEQPYKMKIARWPGDMLLTEEKMFEFGAAVLVDALLKAGLTGGHVIRLPSIDIRV